MRYLLLFLLSLVISITFFAQGLTPKQKKKKWGFVNKDNEWVIKPKFSEVKPFNEGLACVRIKNKWGFIDASGAKIIKPQYSSANSFTNGFAAVRSLTPLAGNSRENNNQYKWGFINKQGTLTSPLLFKTVKDFDEKGRTLVQLFNMKANEFFWINSNGKAISPPFTKKEKIGDIYKIENKRRDGLPVYRFIKPTGEAITAWYLNNFNLEQETTKVWLPSDPKNDTIEVEAFRGNPRKKLCAYINQKGEVLTDWYSEIKPFIKGYAPIRHNHLYGFIDSTYSLTKKPIYRELDTLNKKRYKGQIETGKTAILDLKGKELSLYTYDFELLNKGYFLGKHQLKSSYRNETKYAVFDENGNQKTSWFNKIHTIHNGIVRVEDERLSYDNTFSYQYFYNYVQLESGELISNWRPIIKTTWEQETDSLLTQLFLSTPILNLEDSFFKTLFVKEFKLSKREKTITFSGGDFHNGMAIVAKKEKKITTSKNGLTTTSYETLYGYIDWYGDLVIPYRYKEAAGFREEFAVVGNGKHYGAINTNGKNIIPYNFNMLCAYGSGLFPFLNDKRQWGFVNRKNRIQIEAQFDQTLPFSYGYASVKKGRYWGLIDVMGNEVMSFVSRKPIEIISQTKIRYLKSGVGYLEEEIKNLPLEK